MRTACFIYSFVIPLPHLSPPPFTRFLSIAESEIGVGTDFSLETMSKKLGTNRRRIYDIINVLEALEMIVKQSKNWYTWLGQDGLVITLAKMRVGVAGVWSLKASVNCGVQQAPR
jgi:hypothetical protein